MREEVAVAAVDLDEERKIFLSLHSHPDAAPASRRGLDVKVCHRWSGGAGLEIA